MLLFETYFFSQNIYITFIVGSFSVFGRVSETIHIVCWSVNNSFLACSAARCEVVAVAAAEASTEHSSNNFVIRWSPRCQSLFTYRYSFDRVTNCPTVSPKSSYSRVALYNERSPRWTQHLHRWPANYYPEVSLLWSGDTRRLYNTILLCVYTY